MTSDKPAASTTGPTVRYTVLVSPFAQRRWVQVGRKTRSYRQAMRRVANKLAASNYYTRGRVLMSVNGGKLVTVVTVVKQAPL